MYLWARILFVVIVVSLSTGLWWQFRKTKLAEQWRQSKKITLLLPQKLYSPDLVKEWSEISNTTLQAIPYSSASELINLTANNIIDIIFVDGYYTTTLMQQVKLTPLGPIPQIVSSDFIQQQQHSENPVFWPIGWWVYGVLQFANSWDELVKNPDLQISLPDDPCLLLTFVKAKGLDVFELDNSEQRSLMIEKLKTLLEKSFSDQPTSVRVLAHFKVTEQMRKHWHLPSDNVPMEIAYASIPATTNSFEISNEFLHQLIENDLLVASYAHNKSFASTRKVSPLETLWDSRYLKEVPLQAIHHQKCSSEELIAFESALAEIKGLKP